MNKKLISSVITAAFMMAASSAYATNVTINAGDLPKPDANGNINIKTGPNSGYILTPVPVKAAVKADARVTISDFDQVSQDKINTNIQYALATDPDLTYAAITKDSVTVNYKAPAKLFGFISMHMNIHVVSDADGKVSVSFPWYKFLVASNFNNVSGEMDTVFQNNHTDLETTKNQDPAAAQGQILVQISNVLKAKHDSM